MIDLHFLHGADERRAPPRHLLVRETRERFRTRDGGKLRVELNWHQMPFRNCSSYHGYAPVVPNGVAGIAGRTHPGLSSKSDVTPMRPIAVRISTSRSSSMRSTPAWPPAARDQPRSLPTPTARAPSAIAFTT